MPKIKGYMAWIYDPSTNTYTDIQPAEDMLPELQNLVEHFDVKTLKITLTDGCTMTVQKWPGSE